MRITPSVTGISRPRSCKPTASLTADRIPLLFNNDVALAFAQPTKEDDFFYRNAQGDEIVYVSDGEGVLETQLGELAVRARATTWSSRAASCIAIASRRRR